MSLHVNDKTLIDNLLERHSSKEIFTIISKLAEFSKEDCKEGIVELADQLGLDLEGMIKLCLRTKEGKEHTGEVLKKIFEKMFDIVWTERRQDFKDNWSFEKECYPKIEDLLEKIEEEYVGCNPVLESYDVDDIINFLEDTNDFDDYLENYSGEQYEKGYEDGKEDYEKEVSGSEDARIPSSFLTSLSPDDIWMKVCNQAGCGYYDKMSVEDWVDQLRETLGKSTFARIIERTEKKSEA